MGIDLLSSKSVQTFQNKIDTEIKDYLKSGAFEVVKSYFESKDKYDLENLNTGLWYYFVICELPSKTAHTIWAYDSGMLTLEDIIEGKIWILENWSKEDIYNRYNNFIKKFEESRAFRVTWGLESSFDSFAIAGRDWILRLHNDEKIQIYKEFVLLEKITAFEKTNLTKRVNELEAQGFKKSLDMAIENVRLDPKQYQVLIIRYKQIAETDPKFYKKNGEINLTEIARYIRKICSYKINTRTINQALYRHRSK